MGAQGQWGAGDNGCTGGNWSMGYRGIGYRGYGAHGYRRYGVHGQWATCAMGPPGAMGYRGKWGTGVCDKRGMGHMGNRYTGGNGVQGYGVQGL